MTLRVPAVFRLLAWLLTLGSAALAAESTRPNILLVTADDMAWEHLSIAGCKGVNTPTIDRLARSGVLMRNGFSGAPGCSPSRAALLTGRHVWMNEEASVHFGGFPAKFPTFVDLLIAAGYFAGSTGKAWSPGDSTKHGRTTPPGGPVYNQHTLKPPSPSIKDNDYPANFAAFLAKRPPGQPFCFWYGSVEPHRGYDIGSGRRAGKKLEDVKVPAFLPDTPEVRSDFLDYFFEIEWLDTQLGRAIAHLEKTGEMENTLIIFTGDNGMPMVRAKASCYEYGLHVPLVISWPKRVPGGRSVEDPVGFVDLTATILAAAGVKHPYADDPARAPIGRNLLPILTSPRSGLVDPANAFTFAGHERHTLTRYNDLGYPIRALRTPQYLYLRNLRPERWPQGDPQRIGRPLHAGAYRDIDDQVLLRRFIEHAETPTYAGFLARAVGRRPAEELYDIVQDPSCLQNLATAPAHAAARARLAAQMDEYLKRTNDPRVYGADRDIFDRYPHYNAKNPSGENLYPPPAR
jgi:uncharacterized sulfatase